MLSHLLHPHPAIEPVRLERPLEGAALISPWCFFHSKSPSFRRNHYKDLVSAAVVETWGEYFFGTAKPDEYNQPLLAASEWWKDIDSIVGDILITVGADEVEVDDVEAFATKLKVRI